jgi:hypothetical protein
MWYGIPFPVHCVGLRNWIPLARRPLRAVVRYRGGGRSHGPRPLGHRDPGTRPWTMGDRQFPLLSNPPPFPISVPLFRCVTVNREKDTHNCNYNTYIRYCNLQYSRSATTTRDDLSNRRNHSVPTNNHRLIYSFSLLPIRVTVC